MQYVTKHDNLERTSEIGTRDHRQFMIQVSAYLRAVRRGFQGGDPMQEQLDAAREVDAKLKTAGRNAVAN